MNLKLFTILFLIGYTPSHTYKFSWLLNILECEFKIFWKSLFTSKKFLKFVYKLKLKIRLIKLDKKMGIRNKLNFFEITDKKLIKNKE